MEPAFQLWIPAALLVSLSNQDSMATPLLLLDKLNLLQMLKNIEPLKTLIIAKNLIKVSLTSSPNYNKKKKNLAMKSVN